MKFSRLSIAPIPPDVLRVVGARSGWLLEDANALRVGLGGVAQLIELSSTEASPELVLAKHDLFGDVGPSDSGVVAFGALPFDISEPGVLQVPEVVVTQYKSGETFVTTLDGSRGLIEYLDLYEEPVQETQSVRSLAFEPTPEEYAQNVAAAVEILRRKEIDKVVLARSVKGSVPDPIDIGALALRLHQREPICTLYSLPIEESRRFVGVSPELLVQRFGAEVACNPLAGTIALPPNTPPENYQNWLLGSAKNLHEHKLLVDEVVSVLAGYFDDVLADPMPSIMKLRTVAHLSSWIRASATNQSPPSVMTLLRSLHPTAAVCGIPRVAAKELLTKLENNRRGNYAGPVGWIDATGNGQWWVGIRGVIVAGAQFEAWAGAGIVSESDPIAEREETKDKLSSVLTSILIDRV